MKFRIAVGDVHGMYDLLSPLVEVLRGHFNPTNAAFIFLGDLIDRGPRSRHVLRLVSDIMGEYESSTVILGNHDEYLRSFLDGSLSEEDGLRWSALGGDETLASYGFDYDDTDADILKVLRHKYPKHVELIEGAVQMLITERHCFVHAGVDPTAGISEQDERTTRWIRDDFLNHTKPSKRSSYTVIR